MPSRQQHHDDIDKHHPFVDGNKRTGFVIGVLFLELNGYSFVATEEATAQAVLSLAAGDIEEPGYGALMRANFKVSPSRL